MDLLPQEVLHAHVSIPSAATPTRAGPGTETGVGGVGTDAAIGPVEPVDLPDLLLAQLQLRGGDVRVCPPRGHGLRDDHVADGRVPGDDPRGADDAQAHCACEGDERGQQLNRLEGMPWRRSVPGADVALCVVIPSALPDVRQPEAGVSGGGDSVQTRLRPSLAFWDGEFPPRGSTLAEAFLGQLYPVAGSCALVTTGVSHGGSSASEGRQQRCRRLFGKPRIGCSPMSVADHDVSPIGGAVHRILDSPGGGRERREQRTHRGTERCRGCRRAGCWRWRAR